MEIEAAITQFLAGTPHAVVGASRDRTKYGNKVLRAYQQQGRRVYPVHPREAEIEGLPTFPDLASIPEPVWGVSIVTPPAISASVVEQAGQLGIRFLWLQPGAESLDAIQRAQTVGMNVIAGGPCLLVALHFHENHTSD